MGQRLPDPPPGFDELSVDERIEYVQSLWDRIAATTDEIPVPEWHVQVLKERVEGYRADPSEGTPWDQVRDELARKLRDRTPEK